ncbi:Crp/Fnr family transcriptional regulator [Polaromonas sp.]|uniref:Crp/Fnr family transcriptional regulator n=1 Tax=Polaromonas sp. TaxID=1869339 RepID=UPI0037517DBD
MTCKNRILVALADDDLKRWEPHLEWVDLPVGQVLQETGTSLRYAFFPLNSTISLRHLMKDGKLAEVAVIGNEGLYGISAFMGAGITTNQAVVRSAGGFFRLKAAFLKAEFEQSKSVRELMLRFTQALLTQMSQNSVCNRHHSIKQQVARFLLMSFDRFDGAHLSMTQEEIANMLGVRRESVTDSVFQFRHDGLLNTSRGHITSLDRVGLEKHTCECYFVIKEIYDRLLPPRKG